MFLKLSLRLSILLVFSFLLMPNTSFAKRDAVGAIVAWKGEVYIYHKGATKGLRLEGMEGVYKNDRIVTKRGAKAKLLMKDDTVISLGENAKLEISDYVVEEGKLTRKSLLNLARGKMRAMVGRFFRKKTSIFKVRTPTAVVGVKGTDFFLDAKKGKTELIVVKGKVGVRNSDKNIGGGKEIIVGALKMTTIGAASAPSKPKKVTTDKLSIMMNATKIDISHAVDMKEQGCIGCHKTIFENVNKSKNPHPGAIKGCALCHIKSGSKGKIQEVPGKSSSNLFYVDVQSGTEYKAQITVTDDNGKQDMSKQIRFDVKKVKNIKGNPNTVPTISNPRVKSLKKGLFYEAVIAWETDKLASSEVMYKTKGVAETYAGSRDTLSREHRVTIDRLKKGKKYIFQVTSKDLFGKTAVSQPIEFKVKKEFSEVNGKKDIRPQIQEFEVVAVGRKTALTWKVNKPVKVKVEVAEIARIGSKSTTDPHEPGFNTVEFTGQKSCMTSECHGSAKHSSTNHQMGQVNVAGFIIDRALPMGGQGDILMCGTCHDPHGSNFSNILRKKKKQLCLGCHRDEKYQ